MNRRSAGTSLWASASSFWGAPGMVTRNSGVAEQMKYVAVVVTIAPIVAIYPFLQRYFIKGVMI